jgi:hypothetical protein
MVDADFTIPSLPLVASAVADVSEEAPVDTVPKRKVRRSDYPDDERPEEYSFDLQDPENLKPEAGEYDEKHSLYRVGSKLGDNFLSAPYLMTPQEYVRWTERNSINKYFTTCYIIKSRY